MFAVLSFARSGTPAAFATKGECGAIRHVCYPDLLVDLNGASGDNADDRNRVVLVVNIVQWH